MYLLYLDDSGSVENPKENYVVLGGVCLADEQIRQVTSEMDQIAQRIYPSDPDSVEFHASVIFPGRVEPWKSIADMDQRRQVMKDVLQVLCNAYDTARAFATVVHKGSCGARNPMEVAFEDIVSRFDRFLTRVNDRGLIILDESTHETRLHELSRKFRKLGTRWNAIHRIVDGPLFVSSRAFRCVQLADHVAYAVFRRYEAKDANYFDVFSHRFDQRGGVVHGLRHIETGANLMCMCLACNSRSAGRTPNDPRWANHE